MINTRVPTRTNGSAQLFKAMLAEIKQLKTHQLTVADVRWVMGASSAQWKALPMDEKDAWHRKALADLGGTETTLRCKRDALRTELDLHRDTLNTRVDQLASQQRLASCRFSDAVLRQLDAQWGMRATLPMAEVTRRRAKVEKVTM